MIYQTMANRDFFGGRTLLEGDFYSGEDSLYYMKPSKFRIVAYSAKLEVYVISKSHLSFL
jgi:hypothetical protein